jgi:hypothetical protein
VVLDPNRLAAGILTGIGFLGAATVIRAGDIVRGITTGATVWSTAGLGVVHRPGRVLAGPGRHRDRGWSCWPHGQAHARHPPGDLPRLIVRGLRSELADAGPDRALDPRAARHRLQDLSGTRGAHDQPFELVFPIRCRNEFQAPQMLEQIADQTGVLSVEWSQISH